MLLLSLAFKRDKYRIGFLLLLVALCKFTPSSEHTQSIEIKTIKIFQSTNENNLKQTKVTLHCQQRINEIKFHGTSRVIEKKKEFLESENKQTDDELFSI